MRRGHPIIDSRVRRRIDGKLAEIERHESVRIVLAVESGSRAWGFPSPDSDYDVRFLYVRPHDWYLSIDTRRDVMEYPIEDDIDINGWDIRKALQSQSGTCGVAGLADPLSGGRILRRETP